MRERVTGTGGSTGRRDAAGAGEAAGAGAAGPAGPAAGTPAVRSDLGRLAVMLELLAVFGVGVAGVVVAGAVAGDSLFGRQAVVWLTNVVMLAMVWAGLRLRGQGWSHLGLPFRVPGAGRVIRAVGLSLVVLVAAVAAFVVVGAVLGAAGGGEAADTSGYDYLRGDLPMLILSLAGVYIVSSFGEEVIYRGFLMTRLAELGSGGRAAWGAALAVSAVVFGLAHFAWGLTGVVQTTLMGLVLGGAYLLLGRNLWILVLAHACMDTLLLVPLYFGAP